MTIGDFEVTGSVTTYFSDPELLRQVREGQKGLSERFTQVYAEYAHMRRLYSLERSIARRYDRCCHIGRRIRPPHNYALGAMIIAVNGSFGKFVCDPRVLTDGFKVPT